MGKKDSPSSQHPKVVDGDQKNHENCTFEMTFQQKTSTLFFSATSILFKEKWISSLTYSKYYYHNRFKIRNLFTAGFFFIIILPSVLLIINIINIINIYY